MKKLKVIPLMFALTASAFCEDSIEPITQEETYKFASKFCESRGQVISRFDLDDFWTSEAIKKEEKKTGVKQGSPWIMVSFECKGLR